MSQTKKIGIFGLAALVVAGGGSYFYAKSSAEKYLAQEVLSLSEAGVQVTEKGASNGLFTFTRQYDVVINNADLLVAKAKDFKENSILPSYIELFENNPFEVDITYKPWSSEGEFEITLETLSEAIVHDLEYDPFGAYILAYFKDNNVVFYGEVEGERVSQVGIRDIANSFKHNGADVAVNLADVYAIFEGKEEVKGNFGDLSFTMEKDQKKLQWALSDMNYTSNLGNILDSRGTLKLDKMEVVSKSSQAEARFLVEGITTEEVAKTEGDIVSVSENISIANSSFKIASELEVGLKDIAFATSISGLDRETVQAISDLASDYTEANEEELEALLVQLVNKGASFDISEFSAASTKVAVTREDLDFESGPFLFRGHVNLLENNYNPYYSHPEQLLGSVDATVDFEMLGADFETLKTIYGFGGILDGFVRKEGEQVKVSAKFAQGGLFVNDIRVM